VVLVEPLGYRNLSVHCWVVEAYTREFSMNSVVEEYFHIQDSNLAALGD